MGFCAARTGLKSIVIAALISCGAASAADVCVVNESSVSPETLRYLEASLKAREKRLNAIFRFTCDAEAKEAIVIRLRNAPARNQEHAALGAVRVEDGRVLGQVEVFCNPVREVVRAGWPLSPALEGWAYGTVAAHEMFHFLYNEHSHTKGRLNEATMGANGLIEGFRKLPASALRSD